MKVQGGMKLQGFSRLLSIALPPCSTRRRLRGTLFFGLSALLLLAPLPLSARRAGVHALFTLGAPTGGPFPSDQFTVADATQNTRVRVNLPKPDCQARPSDCEDVDVLNTLDGFNMQPRLSIPFDGQLDVNSVTSQSVFLISLGDTLDLSDRGGHQVGINQVVWDVATNALQVWSDEQLDQHTRYGLFVTRGVRDQSGSPVEATDAFRRFLATGSGDYWTELMLAVRAFVQTGTPESAIVSASVFTTQSATALLEKIRDQIKAATPAPADFRLGSGGSRTVFNLNQVSSIEWNQQNPPTSLAVQVNLPPLQIIPGAVGKIAFGKYVSPVYLYDLPVGSRTGQPVMQGMNQIYFNLFLPSSPKPAAGWPVAIYGHGSGSSKDGDTLNTVATMAAHGIATIAINNLRAGFGARSTLTVNLTVGGSVTFPSGGRSGDRGDPFLQIVSDLMQLVRVIGRGMDIDGDGQADLDPSRIYYHGVSSGGRYGLPFVAVEPDVRAAVIHCAFAPPVNLVVPGRGGYRNALASRQPSLINSPGITSLDRVPVNSPYFNENMPLRDGRPLTVTLADGTNRVIRSPVINTVAGAIAIQEVLDHDTWAALSSAASYAPHLRKNPLPGMAARPVILQFARGDQLAPNPTNMRIVWGGDLADRVTFFRNDLAYAEDPMVPKNPHAFMLRTDRLSDGTISTDPLVMGIARGAQEQIAVFFESNGTRVIHPEPARFFEVPIKLPLPEDLGFIP